MKKLGLVTVALSALLLVGCGGGGSKKNSSNKNTNAIKERKVIWVFQNVYNGRCQEKSNEINEIVSSEGQEINAKNTLVSVEKKGVNCATYGRTNDDLLTCFEFNLEQGTETCVVAFDYDDEQQNKNFKQINDRTLDIREIIFSELL